MSKLIIPAQLHARLYSHLLRDELEHLAFILCSVSVCTDGPIFLGRDILCIDDTDLDGELEHGLGLKVARLLEAINIAIKAKLVLVEAHSHPFSAHPRFSDYDMEGFCDTVPYMLDSMPGSPYGATVWGRDGIMGIGWTDWPQKAVSIRISVVGQNEIGWPSIAPDFEGESGRFDRQIRMLGPASTAKIRKLNFAIAGLSGLGSHFAQQLTHLGADSFVFVDPKLVEEHNLNRIVGARASDVGRPKVDVISDQIRAISPRARVLSIPTDLRDKAALDALKGVDLIFSCVDNDGARLILNELSRAYQIPMVDCGVEARVEDGVLREVGGRINLVVPGGPCLHCMGQIDIQEARAILASDGERYHAQRLGYINGNKNPSPAVISVNGAVASIAIMEFLILLSGARPFVQFLVYDILGGGRGRNSQWLTPQRQERSSGCFECTLDGIGDAVDLARYSPSKLSLTNFEWSNPIEPGRVC